MSIQAWLDARDLLSKAVGDYLDASIALEAASSDHSSTPSLDRSMLWKLFTALDCEHANAEQRLTQLQKASDIIHKTYSRLSLSAPILSLPQELLVHIFTIASSGCDFDSDFAKCSNRTVMLIITRICSDWRQLAINTPKLWSHLDINHEWRPNCSDPFKIEKLWIERALNSPLHVRSSTRIGFSSGYLSLYLDRASSASFDHSFWHTIKQGSDLEQTLSCWLKHASAGSVKEISIESTASIESFDPLMRRPFGFIEMYNSDSAHIQSHLGPLRVLRLRDVAFDWESPAYHGLIYLQVSNLLRYQCPTSQQMANILSACPELRVLKLKIFHVKTIEGDQNSLQPVMLGQLELLDIAGMKADADAFLTLLPLIAPGPGQLELRIYTYFTAHNIERFISFVNRSNLTSLHIEVDSAEHVEAIATCLASTKNLHTLTATFFLCSEDDCNLFLEALATPREKNMPQYGKIHTLKLIGGSFDLKSIQRIVETREIKTLILKNHEAPSEVELEQVIGPLMENMFVTMMCPTRLTRGKRADRAMEAKKRLQSQIR